MNDFSRKPHVSLFLMIANVMPVTDSTLMSILIIAGSIASVVALVFLVLWILERKKFQRVRNDIRAHEQTRIAHELAIADQVGRMKLIRELHQVTVVQAQQVITKALSAKTAVNESDEYSARVFQQIAARMEDSRENMRRILSLVTDGEHLAQGRPRLKSINELFDTFRDAGLVVNVEETGESFELKPGAEIAMYRVLQESLENVLKHAGLGTEVWISLNWEGSGIQINIDDDGVRNAIRQAKDQGSGLTEAEAYAHVDIEKDKNALVQIVAGPGITQMRQRVELFGGFLNAHEVPGVGFSVQANFRQVRLNPER